MTEAEFASRLSGSALGAERGAFAAGTRFGDWRITAFIAKGGTAEVYCAEHATLGTAAALKVLAEPLTDSRKARFVREAKLLAELKSPSFPAFHGYGEANGRPYIAEELLEPGDMPQGDGPRAKFLLALCAGLKTLHVRGIVHRDVKPANILFRKNGEPVIVDLGLAKSVEVPIVPDGVSIVDGNAVGVGTPEYAAPEQFTGGDITPAADIHALGVLTQKLISSSSRRSSRGVSTGEAAAKRSRDSSVAACWRSIIRRATSSIASERYQSVDEFAAAIRRRHWLRNGIVLCLLGLGVAGLVTAHALQSRTKADTPQVRIQPQFESPVERVPREQRVTPPRQEMYDGVQKLLQSEKMVRRGREASRSPQGAVDPFTALFQQEGRDARGRQVYGLNLAGKNQSMSTTERVTLRGSAVYRITGPGALLANIDGEGDVEVEVLNQARLINFTKVPLKDSSIKYTLNGEAHLNLWFLRQEDAPDKLVINPTVDSVTSVTFGLSD